MRPVLFDSSVYIAALRGARGAALIFGGIASETAIWLSAVVLEELYAGADSRQRRAVERLERDFERAGRILVPNLADWTEAGQVLARLGEAYGHERIGRGRLTNDALIAMSAARLGITVITVNRRDFGRLAEFRPFAWEVANA